MKVEYKDDAASGPGNGLLAFSGALLPQGPWSAGIMRSSDQKYLTGQPQNPWIGEAYFMPLEGVVAPSGELALHIGPGVVNELDMQEQYRVILKGGDGGQLAGRLALPAITYSPGGSLHNTARIASHETVMETSAPKEPAPQKLEEPRPEISMPAPGRTTVSPKKIWLYVMAALLLLACAAWYFAATRDGGDLPEPQRPKTELTAPIQAMGAEDQVRQFFNSGKASAQAAAELAGRLPKNSPEEQDAIYRLYYYAANQDSPALLMEYGACLDPSKPQWGTIQKDGALAWEIYEKAVASGSEDAGKAAKDRLREWLRREAAAGNALAKKWLDGIGG